MDRTPVESSVIESVAHDEATGLLTVYYVKGPPYHYEGVPADKVADLLAAESKGKFLNSQIIGMHPHRKAT
jgi:KTSC domain-containing protein